MSGGIVWTGIITGVITATATLLGVWLTQRHNVRMRLLDQHEERRVEQRNALADVLLTGREMEVSLNRLLYTAVRASDHEDFRASKGFVAYRAAYDAQLRALLTARLIVHDPQVLDHMHQLTEPVHKAVEAVMTLVENTEQQGDLGNPALFGAEAFGRIRAYKQELEHLERLTRERVVQDPQEVRRRWWQRVRLPLPGRHSRPSSEPNGTAEAA